MHMIVHVLCCMMYYVGVSICTWMVRVLPLCQSNYGLLNGTVTKHGRTGHGCLNTQHTHTHTQTDRQTHTHTPPGVSFLKW